VKNVKRAILLMGKNQMFLEIKSILPFADYQVLTGTDNGMEGLRMATRYEPNLIIVGWNLTGLQTWDLVSSLVHKNLCPVIIILAPEEHELARQAIQTGAHHVLLYPFSAPDLVAGILQAEHHYQQEVTHLVQVQRLEDELKSRQLIYQAIFKLIKENGCDEETAYTLLRRQSMTTRKSLENIALALIKGTWIPCK